MKNENVRFFHSLILLSILLILPMIACNGTQTPPAIESRQVFVTDTLFIESTIVPVNTFVEATVALSSTVSATSNAPSATFVKDANCRSGPGTNYKIVFYFLQGQTALIVGKNANVNHTWWYVIIPNTENKCWVSLVTTSVSGNLDEVGVIRPSSPPKKATSIAPPPIQFTPSPPP